jgi:mannosyltransferase OCH1-like enzyme
MPGQTPYQKEWIKNNPDKIALYKQRYKEKHGEEIAKKRSLEYFANKPKHHELNKKYYEENKEVIKEQKKEYYQKNKDVIKAKALATYYKKKCNDLKKGNIMDYYKIKRKIHQIYGVFNDGVPLDDIHIFKIQTAKTQEYCKKYDIEYQMWDNDSVNELLHNKYPEWIEFYNSFRLPIQKADFIRYLILYDEGGVYVDCDVAPIGDMSDLFKMNEFFVKWNNDKKELPYNAVLGSVPKSKLYEDIFKQIKHDYAEKSKIKTYDTWVGRFVFQTTGHHMLNRVLKNYKDIPKLDILKIYGKGGEVISDVCPIFEDFNCSSWYSTDGNNLHM